ncbi:enoyl-CoA hydratase [Pseudonocardia sp. NPDC049154]|uniref:enoyl-CoA hydratase n=1 Tax=Pseudonocardia sp. NPDC049154 TaxID=3155501 RepID=UPI0033F853ED
MPENSESTVSTELKDGVLRLTLARPQRLNAVTAPMLDVLVDHLLAANPDPDVRAVVLTGEGRAFCAGADLGADIEHQDGRSGTLAAAHRVVTALRRLRKPVVAAVNGPAVGVGAAFALACDLLVARKEAFFLLAFRDVGLMPDGGITALLPAAVGRARALEMALLGERVPADHALEWGLVNRVAAAEEFDAEVDGIARRLAEGPTLSFGYTKRAVDESLRAALAAAMEREIDSVPVLSASADHEEGVAAFRERRAPLFRGR